MNTKYFYCGWMNIIEMKIKGNKMERNMVDVYVSNLHIGHNIEFHLTILLAIRTMIMIILLTTMTTIISLSTTSERAHVGSLVMGTMVNKNKSTSVKMKTLTLFFYSKKIYFRSTIL